MRGMYRTMVRLRDARRQLGFAAELSRSARAAVRDEPEAVLAALLSQLHRRDTVITEGDDPLIEIAAAEWFPADAAPAMHAIQGSAEECAAVAAGMALRIADKARPVTADDNRHAPRPVVVALLRSFPPLEATLQLIQQQDLSIVLYVAGPPESRVDAQRRIEHPQCRAIEHRQQAGLPPHHRVLRLLRACSRSTASSSSASSASDTSPRSAR